MHALHNSRLLPALLLPTLPPLPSTEAAAELQGEGVPPHGTPFSPTGRARAGGYLRHLCPSSTLM